MDEEGVRETARFFNVDPVFLEGMYHDVMLGPRWTQAAGAISDWLDSIYGSSPLVSAAKPATDVAAAAAASAAPASGNAVSAATAASSEKDKTATKAKTQSQTKAQTQAQGVADNGAGNTEK